MRAARTLRPVKGCAIGWKSLQVKLKSVEDGTVTVLKDLFKNGSAYPLLTSSRSRRALKVTSTLSDLMQTQKMNVADVN